MTRPESRSRRLGILAGLLSLLLVMSSAPSTAGTSPWDQPLFAEGLVAGPDGTPRSVPAGSDAAPLQTPAIAAATRRRLAEGFPPDVADMLARAERDLRLLVQSNGALPAGWTPHWRYHWPRDAAFGSVALAASGDTETARRVNGFTLDQLGNDDSFQARYLIGDGGKVPDDRPAQLDGSGWTLWAFYQWSLRAPKADVEAERAAQRPRLEALTRGLIDSIGARTGLPRPSPDYWETPTTRTTLGNAAIVDLGLRSAIALGISEAEGPQRKLAARIRATFGNNGWARNALGGGGADAAIAFVLPPFAAGSPSARSAFPGIRRALTVPYGGIRPGTAWRDPQTTWTPQTSLFALTEASLGRSGDARSTLALLAAHRTRMGSLPEKIGPTGKPGSVAPLAWTDANVLLAANVLVEGPLTVP